MNSKILLVDDNPGMIQVMARILSGLGQIRFATSGAAALQQAREMVPDLILLDAEMPGMNGYQVCEALKADPALAEVPVIFVTGHSGQDHELKGLEIGAVDFLAKPISEPLLLARVRTQLRVKHLTDELRRIGTVDALTETMNRRAFDEALPREWKRSLRTNQAISLLMVDVDHFKLYNDTYGHPAGDACLRSVALALKSASQRPGDLVARYGGEEFALLLPNTSRDGAEHLAHRVLESVAALKVPHAASPTSDHLTVSIGISYLDQHSPSWAALPEDSREAQDIASRFPDFFRSADKALYAAKAAGRNQVSLLAFDDTKLPGVAPDGLREPPQRLHVKV